MTKFQRVSVPESEIQIAIEGVVEAWRRGDPAVIASISEAASEAEVRAAAAEICRGEAALDVWINDIYQVSVRKMPDLTHLSIKRIDRQHLSASSYLETAAVDLGFVGTLSVDMLSKVAIPAKDLEFAWESALNEPAIKISPTSRSHSEQFSSVLVSATVNVVNGEKGNLRLSTAGTQAAIGGNDFILERKSGLFSINSLPISASSAPPRSPGKPSPTTGHAYLHAPSIGLTQRDCDNLLAGAGMACFHSGPGPRATSGAGNVRLFWSCHAKQINCELSKVNRLLGITHSGWRHFQQIKNELVGPECEGVELYPAESRLVDGANQYHIFCVPDASYRFPFGFTVRAVSDGKIGKSENRKL